MIQVLRPMIFALLFPSLLVSSNTDASPLEINQQAVEQGLPPCDATPGFPCEITVSGAYHLSSDLVSDAPNAHIVEITADDVTLDLAGFSLRGPATCAWGGGTVNCIDTGSGDGVHATSSARVTIRGGNVLNAAANGLALGESAVIDLVHVHGAGEVGIALKAGSAVTRCTVGFTGSFGIEGAFGVSVTGTLVHHAGSVGLSDISLAARNRVTTNDGHGIETTLSAVILDNIVHNNDGDGVHAAIDALVLDNTLLENAFYGLRFATFEGAYGGNIVADNGFGTVSGPGVEVAANSCDGSTTCP